LRFKIIQFHRAYRLYRRKFYRQNHFLIITKGKEPFYLSPHKKNTIILMVFFVGAEGLFLSIS